MIGFFTGWVTAGSTCFISSMCLQVMSLLTPNAVSSQPQQDFSSSPLHGALDSSSSSSTSAGCSHTSADAAVRTGDTQPYCPPTYSSSSYSMDPAVASYQYSQSESQLPENTPMFSFSVCSEPKLFR